MSSELIQAVEQEHRKKNPPRFQVGDTVEVHVRIIEGEKERIQVFGGTVIARKGSGMGETFTVRRIVNNEGVERVFPVHSPKVMDVAVRRSGHTRRAKLYYLRERVGKRQRLRDRRRGLAAAEERTAEKEAEPTESPDAADSAQ